MGHDQQVGCRTRSRRSSNVVNGCHSAHHHRGGNHQPQVGRHLIDHQQHQYDQSQDLGRVHQLVLPQTVAIPPPSSAVAPYSLPPPPMRVTAPTPTMEEMSAFNCDHCCSLEPTKNQQRQWFQQSNHDHPMQQVQCQKELSAKAASPLGPDTLAKEELQVEIRRLRERIKGLESENTTMHIKLSKTQQDVDQRLTDIEMQIGPEEPPLFVGVAAGKSANDDCPIFVGVRSATTTTTTTSGSASCSGNSGADEEEEEDEKNRESFI